MWHDERNKSSVPHAKIQLGLGPEDACYFLFGLSAGNQRKKVGGSYGYVSGGDMASQWGRTDVNDQLAYHHVDAALKRRDTSSRSGLRVVSIQASKHQASTPSLVENCLVGGVCAPTNYSLAPEAQAEIALAERLDELAKAMSLQLHVWGPAFGLESIDAECLAIIAAFRHIFSSDEWSLIASNDTSLNPDHTLPALFHDGTWIPGYENIVTFLVHHITSCANPLADNHLTPQQKADLLAYSSYLTTRGSGLVALSLYASPNAWVELTRPAYSALLPFPLTWTIPTAIRAAAIEKAESLGMAT
ncbi:hypothetical protein NUW58_g8114 [Xylaria curta]|uniref:Uncharacterized protein n=1 Tax=Xylaria curta TaxID=42375 RepID=A0ACC1NAI3_9PEZI|nr:hypothetical protein NUW58_g8114 [Xylaria curta]